MIVTIRNHHRVGGAGGTGYWSYSSCASAYMLMYRRKDPELNIRSVGEADLPATLTAEIAATAEKEAAEKERERCDF